jgi:peptidoglycan-associated lipoprotein
MNRLLTMIITGLVLASCATKKPVNDGAAVITDIKEVVLELNGDSDSDKAGKIKTVIFAYDSSSLDNTAKQILKENSDYMKLNKPISVQIEGHCDERGGRQYNLALGERRAAAVRNYMRALGVNADRMKIISLGNEKPLVAGDGEHSRAKNRRANFIILSK